ncbi:uncharacterized protein L969DRAFT_86032 [Mixia osmundae IAM 14324]|uniref:Protein transport protein SEC31 n=1 Tax=Mixia osmundae (strain CBS 9802 / IAM 14324 / JCM 22182 / KY 12970) TaxID=764103 RepID=G7E5D3_MIXOS|nr:uncharacterized protein L969DRAFT_86032 [Mixia osmundae IAM 14324]KEI40805.1 hypothetical protein L969DRAFT_86032 [Mixia osmundae IAM 14324]GAA98043.1 hypothetical protein E5Q_04724 [Mixia osmundae IAM 14324]
MTLVSLPRTATLAWSPNSTSASKPIAGAKSTPSRVAGLPLLATGTVSGAVDDQFSNESILEIWSPFYEGPSSKSGSVQAPQKRQDTDHKILGKVAASSRFNKIVWTAPIAQRPKGVIAAGMDSGELAVWDPSLILNGKSTDSMIYKTTHHTGPIKGLSSNPSAPHLLASGSIASEIYIWDLTSSPLKPYSPGARSRNLDDITSLAWNNKVPHVLASGSNTGYTVVWDLKGKKEVVSLAFNAAAQGQPQGGPMQSAPNSRSGISAVVWHPDNATKLITASDDDVNPIIMVWDLRHSRAPEKILTGHDKGVLSLSWCKSDPELLLSSGKDNRTLCWNPESGEIVGELPRSNNWSFEAQWCPFNPFLLATASFDGIIGVHSLQSTAPAEQDPINDPAQHINDEDIFDTNNISLAQSAHPGVSLTQPPAWLKRPASATFGFGGKLVQVKASPAPAQVPQVPGQPPQPKRPHLSMVTISQIVTEKEIIERALKLETAIDEDSLAEYCQARARESAGSTILTDATSDKTVKDSIKSDLVSWRLLSTLFRADSRDELVTLLGFSKEEVKGKVEAAVQSLRTRLDQGRNGSSTVAGSELGDNDSGSVAREPLVSFAADQRHDEALSGSSEGEAAAAVNRGNSVSEATPSEAPSLSMGTDTTKPSEGDSEVTEPSLFGDDPVQPGTPGHGNAADDFYAQIGTGRPHTLLDRNFGRESAVGGSSIAATAGSRPSSIASEALKPTTFNIYPSGESDADRLITRAVVLGDFDSAVALCLTSDRFADALLLAFRGGPDLLARTQKAYFERHTTSLPYLRLFQSIVLDDLTDVVQNADLTEWQEIFVVLCTFARADEYASLTEQLGQRLEFQSQVEEGSIAAAKDHRKNAVLCYLASGKLEKVVSIWAQEMKEEEEAALKPSVLSVGSDSRYALHAKALQTFIEKVTIFQRAVKYVDADLSLATSAPVEGVERTYKLASLYDRYAEYAQILAAQGLVTTAVKIVAQVPADYNGKGDIDAATVRSVLLDATGQASGAARPSTAAVAQQYSSAPRAQPVTAALQSSYAASSYASAMPAGQQQLYQQPAQPRAPMQQQQQNPHYDPYAQATTTYAPPQNTQPQNPYSMQASQSASYAPTMQMSNPYAMPQQQPGQFMQPASMGNVQSAKPVLPPPPPKREEGAWNDVPTVAPKRTASAAASRQAAPIMSPFPHSGPMSPSVSSFGAPSYLQGQQQSMPPPPPPSRGAMRPQASQVGPPPPKGAMQHSQPNGAPQYGQAPQQSQMHLQQQQSQQSGPPMQRDPYAPPINGMQGNAALPPQGPSMRMQGPPPPPPQQQPVGPPPPRRESSNAYGPPPPAAISSGPSTMARPGSVPPAAYQPSPYDPPAGTVPNSAPTARGPQQNGGQFAPPPTGFRPPPGQQPVPMQGPPRPASIVNQQGPRATPPPQARPEPPKPKYPPGDRSHIPDYSKPIFASLDVRLKRLIGTQSLPKKVQDDTIKRMLVLFDALNCDTISRPTVDKLAEIIRTLEAGDANKALQLHLELLSSVNQTEDIGPWMPALKLIIRSSGP